MTPQRSRHQRGLRIRRAQRGGQLPQGVDRRIRPFAPRRCHRDRRGHRPDDRPSPPVAAISRLLSIEPDPQFAAHFRGSYPNAEFIEGTIEHAPAGVHWDGILSINVLEHIQADEAELSAYANFLSSRRGALCLFVPARPEIYAPIDKDFGHFRRYTRPELRRKLGAAGFTIERLIYFNWVGYFAWWLNFRLLKKRRFEVAKVRAFDQLIFPIVHRIESSLFRPPFGQSLLAIARARPN